MLNFILKKEAEKKLKKEKLAHDIVHKRTIELIQKLDFLKQRAKIAIEEYKNKIINIEQKPEELLNKEKQVELNINIYENNIKNAQAYINKEKKSRGENILAGVSGAGIVAGAGLLLYGESTAIAIATTFGAASTGAAISVLSSAAATNVALAWLGGGTLALGGGGVLAGKALLTLTGPVGWAILAGSLFSASALAYKKNKEFADACVECVKALKESIEKLNEITKMVRNEVFILETELETFLNQLEKFSDFNKSEYSTLSQEDKKVMLLMHNMALVISEKIAKKIE